MVSPTQLSPFVVKAITTEVYVDDGRFDGRRCIVLDYSRTARVAGFVRDEIRRIGPALCIGVVHEASRMAPLRVSPQFDTTSQPSGDGADENRDDHHASGSSDGEHRPS